MEGKREGGMWVCSFGGSALSKMRMAEMGLAREGEDLRGDAKKSTAPGCYSQLSTTMLKRKDLFRSPLWMIRV